MKKKIMTLVFIIAIMSFVLSVTAFATESIKATKTYSTILVDGVNKNLDAYNINGNNYFKLRDIAYVLNNTDKQFEVKWDNKNQRISIITEQPYTPIEGERISRNKLEAQNVVSTTSEIYLDGQKILLSSYNIDGNNYFKLRDLGEKINFGVLWNNTIQTVQIYSTCGYSEEIIEPWDYVKILGKGIDVDWSKTNNGRKYYNKQTVKDFKEAGISHVRIRIANEATDELLQGLDKQISDCLENGIIPIIAYQGDKLKNKPNEKNIKEVIEWWSIVAKRYKDYSHLLSFDLLIEVTDDLNKQPQKLNEIYERLVTEIRKTNPSRIIIISPRLRSDAQYLKELKIPTRHNGYMMAEWHFYASGPSKTNERKLWTIGTNEEKRLINDKINEALLWQKQMGIPTWVGAWMPGNYNDGNDYSIEEQIVFAKYMTTQLSQAGIPFAVNSDTKYYDRKSNKWIKEMIPVFNSIFKSKLT
ncbi:cellulase family glycosylhydrolase [Tepidibacter hydrothermalis]|uniref:Cellulase family glycosylhydrolase n=1 Tax=Tepidibacter hydrothermalis TaxID=3036126 RepID=A0ABY8EFW5_9FIRM|nr:cellulase family glycosylhydrolase [Tepidibacter hydrothermalis]WFD11823.1 cellulase family glycosylhydrolase [Tepidibacter hydrothermalis]